MKRIISLLLIVALLLPNFMFLAEAKTVQSGQKLEQQEETNTALMEDGKTLAGDDTSYLKISMEKYGETITASSEQSAEVSVLEYTQWQMSARFVRIYEGKVVEDKDVTLDCEWIVTDTTGETLAVTSDGTVFAKKASDVGYVVSATYKGIVTEKDDDGIYYESMKTFCACMDFFVTQLAVQQEDTEALRCSALNYLANNEWEDMQSYQGKTVSEWVADIQKDDYWTASPNTGKYLLGGGYEGSAKVFHFLNAAAGDCTIETYASSSDDKVRALVFCDESGRYIAYAFGAMTADKLYAEQFAASENRGLRRSAIMGYWAYEYKSEFFQLAYKLYRDIAGDAKNTMLIGQYFGGTLAKYIAYITGCKSVSFNAPSPIQYAFLYNFDDLCRNYSIDRQISYNYPMYTAYTQYSNASTAYAVEPGYTVCNLSDIMVDYDYSKEHISINKKESEFKREQTVWNRTSYLGSDGIDYEITVKENGTGSIIFGGAGDDKITSVFDWGIILGGIFKFGLGELEEHTFGIKRAIATAIVGAKKANAVTFLHDVLDFAVDKALSYSMVNRNYIVGGKNYDVIYGPTGKTNYIYSMGDGYDTYYIKDSASFYFLGCEDTDIKFYEKPSEPKKVFVSINGTEQMEIDYSLNVFFIGDISFYKGNPFDPESVVSVGSIAPEFMCHAFYQSACPVDMLIYDSNGIVIQQLLDGTEYYEETEYGIFAVSLVNGEYIKQAFLYDDSYHIQLRGVEDGTMRYFMVKFDAEDSGKYCAVEDIPVKKGATYHASDDPDQYILAVDLDADGTTDKTVTYDTTIALAEETVRISCGTQKQLAPEIRTSSIEKDCYWISANEDVVTVDDKGVLTAVGIGETVVYAIADDGSGAYDICKVIVPKEALSAQNFVVTGLESVYDYTGKIIDVQLNVSYGILPLLQDVHYTAEFSELIEPGKATLTITGINDYTGTLTLNYEILAPEEPDTVEEKVDWIAAKCRAAGISDEWEIALWLHDWLIYNANYDYTYTYYHPDGVLLNGTGVCQSYTEAYALLLNEFSIENRILQAPEMNHSWNLVKIDGEWCHIDCTWDDPGTGGAENHDYFGPNDALISRDHFWSASNLPKATSLINYYPLRTGANVVRSVEELDSLMSELAQEQTENFTCYYIGNDPQFSIFDEFYAWCAENDWKYGLALYSVVHSNGYMINAGIVYTDPWDPPIDISEGLACFDFTLRGPDGVYPVKNYSHNGIIIIFGNGYDMDTQALLERMNGKSLELRAKGVQTFANIDYTEKPSDFDDFKKDYPNITCTYQDEILREDLLKLVPRDSGWYVYDPVVFVFNGQGQITYYHSGNMTDITELLKAAEQVSTGKPLPEPEVVDKNYVGSIFCYTGDRNALAAMIDQHLKEFKPHILVRDGTWNSSQGYWDDEPLGSLVMEILEPYRDNTHLYTIPEYWDYYSGGMQIQIDIAYAENATQHFLEYQEPVEPTCYSYGMSEGQYCKICGLVIKQQQYLYPLDHVAEQLAGTPVSCTQDGLTTGSRCTLCGTILREQQRIPATGHTEETVIAGYDATCTRSGMKAKIKCSVCDVVIQQQAVIPAAGHRKVTVSGTPPTCMQSGLSDGIQCEVCKCIFEKQNEIPATGHLWDEGTVLVAPTDDLPGEQVFTCTVCEECKNVVLPPLSHIHSYTDKTIAPTCVDQGYTTHGCDCGHTYTDNYVDALGHSFVSGICSVCGTLDDIDVNGDGILSESDAIYLIWHTLFPLEYPLEQNIADINDDGKVTDADAVELLWYALELE